MLKIQSRFNGPGDFFGSKGSFSAYLFFLYVALSGGILFPVFIIPICTSNPVRVIVFSAYYIVLFLALGSYNVAYFSNPGYIPKSWYDTYFGEGALDNIATLYTKASNSTTSNDHLKNEGINSYHVQELNNQSTITYSYPISTSNLTHQQSPLGSSYSSNFPEQANTCQIQMSVTPLNRKVRIPLFCEKCKKRRPSRTHHCRVCKKCIMRMDHHCFWAGFCVGARNHKAFVLFLAYGFLGTGAFALAGWKCSDQYRRQYKEWVIHQRGINRHESESGTLTVTSPHIPLPPHSLSTRPRIRLSRFLRFNYFGAFSISIGFLTILFVHALLLVHGMTTLELHLALESMGEARKRHVRWQGWRGDKWGMGTSSERETRKGFKSLVLMGVDMSWELLVNGYRVVIPKNGKVEGFEAVMGVNWRSWWSPFSVPEGIEADTLASASFAANAEEGMGLAATLKESVLIQQTKAYI